MLFFVTRAPIVADISETDKTGMRFIARFFLSCVTFFICGTASAGLDGEYRTIFLENIVPACIDGERGNTNFNQKQILQWCVCKFNAVADVANVQDIVNFSKGVPMPSHVQKAADSASVACIGRVMKRK